MRQSEAYKKYTIAFIFTAFGAISSCATTNTPNGTSLLEPVPGHQGDLIGATVQKVNPKPDDGIIEYTVTVPGGSDDISSITVVDEKDRNIKQAKPFVFTKNSDGQPDGIIIFLKRNQRIPFRLKFNDEE